jgi:hypothetical protein
MAVLHEELGKHPLRVFTFKGRPVGQANTRAWRNAPKRAALKVFLLLYVSCLALTRRYNMRKSFLIDQPRRGTRLTPRRLRLAAPA